ncbi:MAG TPA: LysM peptidoglycan-binding domain-containing protein, partial [Anseongella sp.]|nr:LysM peptidoglycan-binding domain-containing protein [Anseongella sp.]
PPDKAELYARLGKAGDGAEAVAVSDAGPDEVQEPVVYRVKPGDNLTAIANRFRCSVQDLKAWNDLRGTYLVPGQKLRIEGAGPGRHPAEKEYLAKTYKVKRGDTLLGIAERFNTSVAVLKELNGIGSANSLRAGRIIKINPEG